MGALSSARDAGATLVRNPILFLAAATFALVQAPQLLLQANGFTLVASVFNLATVLVTPFLVGGLYGMAREGLDGTTSFATFVDQGRTSYVPLLVASIFFAVAVFVVVFVGSLVLVFVTALTVGLGGLGSGLSPSALAAPALVGLVLLLAYLLAVVFLQFYEAAIVVDDAGVLDSFKRSFGFVRENFISTLGFTAIRWFPNVASLAVTGFFLFTALDVDPDTPATTSETLQAPYAALTTDAVLALLATTLVTTVVLGAFTRTYLVAFYVDNRTEPAPTEEVASADDDYDDLFDEEYDTIS